jgi:hypothetical protein
LTAKDATIIYRIDNNDHLIFHRPQRSPIASTATIIDRIDCNDHQSHRSLSASIIGRIDRSQILRSLLFELDLMRPLLQL